MAGLITISHKTPRRSATIVTGSRLVILRGCNAFSQTLKISCTTCERKNTCSHFRRARGTSTNGKRTG